MPGEGMVECVMLRSLPEGEWDVKAKCSLASLMREQVDSGSAQLRKNQEETKHAALSEKLGQAFVVDGQKPKSMASLETAAAAAPHAEGPGAGGGQQDSSDEDSSDDSDPLRGAVLSLGEAGSPGISVSVLGERTHVSKWQNSNHCLYTRVRIEKIVFRKVSNFRPLFAES